MYAPDDSFPGIRLVLFIHASIMRRHTPLLGDSNRPYQNQSNIAPGALVYFRCLVFKHSIWVFFRRWRKGFHPVRQRNAVEQRQRAQRQGCKHGRRRENHRLACIGREFTGWKYISFLSVPAINGFAKAYSAAAQGVIGNTAATEEQLAWMWH